MSLVSSLSGRSDVLAATDNHPYAQFATGMADAISGIAVDDAVLWWGDGPLGRLAHGMGSPALVESLVGQLPAVGRVNLPRGVVVPSEYEIYDDWDFRWLTRRPPVQPGQERVRPITDDGAILDLLDAAFPDSMLRPGHPMALGWYGIWSGERLVACAVDRSSRSVGVLGAIAVHPDHRRQGLGAAVTVALTEVLLARYPLVGLGVISENDAATDLYVSLGFTGAHEITSYRPG